MVVNGIMGSLLRALFDRKGVPYRVRPVDADQNFGVPMANNTWSGQSGLVQGGEVDLMLGPVVMNVRRSQIMDFSWPFIYDRIGILSHAYDARVTFDYLRGLRSSVWALILITLVFSILLFVLKEWIIIGSIDGKLFGKYLDYYLRLIFAKSEYSMNRVGHVKPPPVGSVCVEKFLLMSRVFSN